MLLVTGGAGFIGSHVVRELNALGRTDIIIVDDLTDGRKYENIKDLKFLEYVDVDEFLNLVRQHKIKVWSNVEKIFHIGGISSTTEMNGKKVMHYNDFYTAVIYAESRPHNIPFVFTSSASVYGIKPYFKENIEPAPLNLYALSKVMAERALNEFEDKNTYIFRPFNVYGSHEDHKDDQASPITKFKKQLNENGTIKVFTGSESIKRDFIWVGDVAKIMVNYTTEGNGGTYNLGTGEAVSFKDIAVIMAGADGIVEEIPFPKHLLNKYQYYSCADVSKLRNLIGTEYKFQQVTDYAFTLPDK